MSQRKKKRGRHIRLDHIDPQRFMNSIPRIAQPTTGDRHDQPSKTISLSFAIPSTYTDGQANSPALLEPATSSYQETPRTFLEDRMASPNAVPGRYMDDSDAVQPQIAPTPFASQEPAFQQNPCLEGAIGVPWTIPTATLPNTGIRPTLEGLAHDYICPFNSEILLTQGAVPIPIHPAYSVQHARFPAYPLESCEAATEAHQWPNQYTLWPYPGYSAYDHMNNSEDFAIQQAQYSTLYGTYQVSEPSAGSASEQYEAM